MKTLVIFLAMALLSAVAPAQVYTQGGEFNRAMAGPNREFRERNAYGRYSNGYYGYGGGYYGGRGYGYNSYYGRGDGRVVIAAVAGGIIGGVIGSSIGGGQHITVIGGGAYNGNGSVVVTNSTSSYYEYQNYNQKTIDCSKKGNQKKAPCQQIAAEQQAAALQAAAVWTLHNQTGFRIDVTDCGRVVGQIGAGQSSQAVEAQCVYKGSMMVPSNSTPGKTERFEADFRLANNKSGWVFTAPRVGGGS